MRKNTGNERESGRQRLGRDPAAVEGIHHVEHGVEEEADAGGDGQLPDQPGDRLVQQFLA